MLAVRGETGDAADVPAALGRGRDARREVPCAPGPVIATGDRWFFLTAPGGRLPGPGGDVRPDRDGFWIMLPLGPGAGGEPVTWRTRPARPGWSLPPTLRTGGLGGSRQASPAPA